MYNLHSTAEFQCSRPGIHHISIQYASSNSSSEVGSPSVYLLRMHIIKLGGHFDNNDICFLCLVVV